jgi:ribosomal protein L29
MGFPQITNVSSMSNNEISEAIIQNENELFNLRFKKSTRQSFKSHEIKQKKCNLIYLKSVLTFRIKAIEKKQNSIVMKLAQKNLVSLN